MAGKREKEDAATKPLAANIVATGSTEFTGDELPICLSRRIDAVRLKSGIHLQGAFFSSKTHSLARQKLPFQDNIA